LMAGLAGARRAPAGVVSVMELSSQRARAALGPRGPPAVVVLRCSKSSEEGAQTQMGPGIAPGPHSRSHWRALDWRLRLRAVGGGSPFDTTGDFSPAIWAARPSAEALGVGYPSLSFRRPRRTCNHRSPALAGVDRSPGGGAEAPQVPEGRSGQPLMALAFAAFRKLRPKPSFSSSASASAGGCPAGFSPPRVTPFPSGPKTFRRGVAASARAASSVQILSAFQ